MLLKHRELTLSLLQVSSLAALMQDMVVDALLLDLRDEDEFTQYHLKGGALAFTFWLLDLSCCCQLPPHMTQLLTAACAVQL